MMRSSRPRFFARYCAITFVAALMSVPALGLVPLGAWLVAMIYLADFIRKWPRR